MFLYEDIQHGLSSLQFNFVIYRKNYGKKAVKLYVTGSHLETAL